MLSNSVLKATQASPSILNSFCGFLQYEDKICHIRRLQSKLYNQEVKKPKLLLN